MVYCHFDGKTIKIYHKEAIEGQGYIILDIKSHGDNVYCFASSDSDIVVKRYSMSVRSPSSF